MIQTHDELTAVTAAISQIDANKAEVMAAQEDELTEVRERYSEQLYIMVDGERVHVDVQRKKMVDDVQEYFLKNRKTMLPKGKKSVELTHCILGYPKGQASVEELKQSKAQLTEGLIALCVVTINASLKLWGRLVGSVPAVSLLRVSVEWDKPAVMKAFKEEQVKASDLKAVGLRIKPGKAKFTFKAKVEKPDQVKPEST